MESAQPISVKFSIGSLHLIQMSNELYNTTGLYLDRKLHRYTLDKRHSFVSGVIKSGTKRWDRGDNKYIQNFSRKMISWEI
jgi:hypothetical protein